jgi:uncharacterized protein YndB with AHSA1/START domain
MSSLEMFLNLRRTFNAPREQVFRAWTEPEALERWLKPMDSTTRVSAFDLRVGGSYQFDFHGKDGSFYSVSGHYIEITPPEKLCFTWQAEITDNEQTLVTLEFIERGSTTEIALTHERLLNEPMLSAHEAGWNWMLDELGTFL